MTFEIFVDIIFILFLGFVFIVLCIAWVNLLYNLYKQFGESSTKCDRLVWITLSIATILGINIVGVLIIVDIVKITFY